MRPWTTVILTAGALLCVLPRLARAEGTAEARFAAAEAARYQRRNYGKAIETYREVATQYPKSPWAPRALDMIAFTHYYNLKECAKAVQAYDELAAKYPRTPESDYGLFVAGNLLFRVLQKPGLAAQRHCYFLSRCREVGLKADPTIARAENQLWRAAQRLCIDKDSPKPTKGTLQVKGNVRSRDFGVYFPPSAEYSVKYELTLEHKTFEIQAEGDIGRGFLTVFVDDLYTPYRVHLNDKPYPCHALLDKHMVVAGIEAGKTYAVRGQEHRNQITVKGAFQCEAFQVWFSDKPDVVVELDYDVATNRKVFAFDFEEMFTDKRGKITMPLKEGETSVRVLQEGRPFDKFRIEGLEREKPDPTKRRVEPPKPRKITLIVEEVNPTKTYVIEPAGSTPQDALDEPDEEEDDEDLP